MSIIYLDNAATTRVSDRAMEAARPFFQKMYGNPGSTHAMGRIAAAAVATAREQVASLFHTTPEHIIFTSGATEANSMVFSGPMISHSLVSAGEHHSVLNAALNKCPEELTHTIGLKPDGVVDLSDLDSQMLRYTDFDIISVMFVNNETGAVNPIEEIGRRLYNTTPAQFHCDCTQAVGSFDLSADKYGFDFASISAHKFHGPKGIGALYVRDTRELGQIIFGGENQEFGLRGGTENVPGIVAMGAAAEEALEHLKTDTVTNTLKNVLYTSLKSRLAMEGYNPDELLAVNGQRPDAPGRILSLRIRGVDANTLVLILDSNGVCVSAGPACSSKGVSPSHVLKAMGLTDEQASSTIRVSFSGDNTVEETQKAGYIIGGCIHTLLSLTEV